MLQVENELSLLSDASLLGVESFEALVNVLSELALVAEEGVDHLHLLEVLLRHFIKIMHAQK